MFPLGRIFFSDHQQGYSGLATYHIFLFFNNELKMQLTLSPVVGLESGNWRLVIEEPYKSRINNSIATRSAILKAIAEIKMTCDNDISVNLQL